MRRGFFSGKTDKVAQRLASATAAAHNLDALRALLHEPGREDPGAAKGSPLAPGAVLEWWIYGMYVVRTLVQRTLAEVRTDRDALLEDFFTETYALFSDSNLSRAQQKLFIADVEQRLRAYDALDNDDQRLDSAAGLLLAPEVDRYSRFRFVFQHLVAAYEAKFAAQVRRVLASEPE